MSPAIICGLADRWEGCCNEACRCKPFGLGGTCIEWPRVIIGRFTAITDLPGSELFRCKPWLCRASR